jgi:xylulokinase
VASEITVGIDIGTSSVKAIAADPDGNVVASSRVPHEIQIPAADRFQHDAVTAWRDGPVAALDALALAASPLAVSVAAMVPSLTAVDDAGIPHTPGLLYGDGRGRSGNPGGNPVESRELLEFLRWSRAEYPEAAGFWPATAVANHALGGDAVLDTSTAATAFPLFDWTGWDPEVAASLSITVEQLPRLVPTAWECGRVGGADGPVLASGCIDALADQIVSGADREGDVLVLLGTTLIVNLITPRHDAVPGYWVIPYTAPGLFQAGGPSNAGGLFVNWATAPLREAGDVDAAADPHRVPVWAPYPRGERVPLHDPDRRAVLAHLDLTHGVAALRRAAFEASGFVARRTIEAAADAHGVTPRRIVATGGGTRVDEWVHALADCTGLPVECVAVPDGAALGSAFLARCALGLEAGGMTAADRWARPGRTVDPDAAWVGPANDRYQRFRELSA